jgi:hypothetical protein
MGSQSILLGVVIAVAAEPCAISILSLPLGSLLASETETAKQTGVFSNNAAVGGFNQKGTSASQVAITLCVYHHNRVGW